MAWRVGADRDLPIRERDSWDGDAVRERIFSWAGWPDSPDPDRAKRAFLVYNDEEPELKGSYKLPFADVVDGELYAITAGIRAAASRLPQTDIPEDVKERARSVLDSYLERMREEQDRSFEEAFRARKPIFRSISDTIVRRSSDQRTYNWVITSGRVDRYDSIIDVDGAHTQDYMRYGVVLFNHDPDRPVGKTVHISRRNGELWAQMHFDEEDEFSRRVRGWVDRGIVRSASIGFIPHSWRWEKTETGKEVVRFTDWELVEWSVVTVPANPDALMLSASTNEMRQALQLILELSSRVSRIERALEELVPREAPPVSEHKEQAAPGSGAQAGQLVLDRERIRELVREEFLRAIGKR